MAVRTWVGRFCVVDGNVQEEGAWLSSLVRRRPDDDSSDELYVLVEPVGPGNPEYAAQLVDVITSLYQRDALSLTGALSRALRSAHDHLREWNRKSLREHRIGAGTSCLALRGSEAYIAQAGPSLAYVRSAAGDFRRIEPPQADEDSSVGVADPFEPWITRVELEAGDLVLLASSYLDRIAPEEHIGRILARDPDEALPELYLLCRDEPNCSVVLLSCFELREEPPEYLTRVPDGSAPHDDAAAAVARDTQPDALAGPQPVLVGAGGDAPEPATASLAGTFGDFDLPARPPHEEVRELTATNAPPPSLGVRVRDGVTQPRYKRTTGGGLPEVRVPRLAVFAVVALVLVGLIAWWQFPGAVEDSREDRFIALVATAREANAQAQATSDPGLKRTLLADAREAIADAEEIHDDNAELIVLRDDVASAQRLLDAVFEVNAFEPVVDLAQTATDAVEITQTVIGGGNAFLLDAEGSRVLRVPLDGSAPPEDIIKQGELAGVFTAGNPVAMAWSDSTGGLVVIDDADQPFEYFPDRGTLPLAVRDVDQLASVSALATSSGNLYVLDVAAGQVWRYLPGQGGFDSERTGLLDEADLADATEIAVGESVYLLDREVGIRRFSGSGEQQFPLAGIDRPLLEPAALAVLPGSNRLIVADRGNQRVVVVSAEGEFLRQIVSTSFTDLRSVWVDEGTSTMYVLNGDVLLRAPFPP